MDPDAEKMAVQGSVEQSKGENWIDTRQCDTSVLMRFTIQYGRRVERELFARWKGAVIISPKISFEFPSFFINVWIII